VAQLTGTEVPYYLLINPEGVREIVDSMGGVEIEVPEAVSGRASSTGSEITLSPGPQTLDGDRVLLYLQGKDLRDDVERAERQRDFLHAMFRQALSPPIYSPTRPRCAPCSSIPKLIWAWSKQRSSPIALGR
jgi:polyisoprenyl-teichoic acid--peptidoglycan teichoic acid transferase